MGHFRGSGQRRSGLSAGEPYDVSFWLCYIANTALMIGISLLFRYSDFVSFLGGSEVDLGLIVGVGMVGALGMRAFQGVGIDRFGPRVVWLGSVALYALSLLGHLVVTRVDTPPIYLLRIIFMVAVSGAFGASITFVSLRAPPARMAEMIGVLGTSGFLGTALGPALGDRLFGAAPVTQAEVHGMFQVAAVMGAVALLLAALATRRSARRVSRRLPPVWGVVRRYHPGSLLLVAVAMGLGLQLPTVFLRPFAQHLGLAGVQTFFLVYAASAFLIRVLTRRWTDSVGARPVALIGLGCLAASMLSYLPVRREWELVLPAVMSGIAHAILFPAVVSGGSLAFPIRYRGLATTLMLAMFDLGVLLGQPAVGLLVHGSRRLGWAPYGVTFVVVAAVLLIVAVVYALSPARTRVRTRRLPALLSPASVAPPIVKLEPHAAEPASVHFAQSDR